MTTQHTHEIRGIWMSNLSEYQKGHMAATASAEEKYLKLLNERDEFIVSKGLWDEFTKALATPLLNGEKCIK